MPDTTPFDRDHPVVDPERKAPKNASDASDHYSGQDYDLERERIQAREHPEGEVDPAMRPGAGTEPATNDTPPEAGRRASIDPRTGEVHGSGSGAGGGNEGEDYDQDSKGGGGYPDTGSTAGPFERDKA